MSRQAFRVGPDRQAGQLPLVGLSWRHGLVLALAAIVWITYSQFISGSAPSTESATATLLVWVPFILKGFMLNLLMSFMAMAVATVFGVALGLMQISRSRFLRLPAWFVTHLFRNSPWLVILFMVMFLVPFEVVLPNGARAVIPDWIKATFAFSLPVMANISEILRGAINSIPKGQWESAESLAFTRAQTLRWVVLPQCVRRAIPSWMNWYALLALATPMASILGVREAVGNAQAAMEAAGGRPEFLVPFYLFLLCLFFVYIYPIAVWTRKLERKYSHA